MDRSIRHFPAQFPVGFQKFPDFLSQGLPEFFCLQQSLIKAGPFPCVSNIPDPGQFLKGKSLRLVFQSSGQGNVLKRIIQDLEIIQHRRHLRGREISRLCSNAGRDITGIQDLFKSL